MQSVTCTKKSKMLKSTRADCNQLSESTKPKSNWFRRKTTKNKEESPEIATVCLPAILSVESLSNVEQTITTLKSLCDLKTASQGDVIFSPYFRGAPFPQNFLEIEFPSESLYYVIVRRLRREGYEVYTGRMTSTPGEPFAIYFGTESVREKYNRMGELAQKILSLEIGVELPIKSDAVAFLLVVNQFCRLFSSESNARMIV